MCIFRHRLGPVQKDGFQYCSKCGKAILAPCNHNWELIANIHKKYDWSYKLAYGQKDDCIERIYECSKCKEIKREKL